MILVLASLRIRKLDALGHAVMKEKAKRASMSEDYSLHSYHDSSFPLPSPVTRPTFLT